MTSKGLAAALCLLMLAPAATRAQQTTVVWDVRDTGQTGQLSIYNSDLDGSAAGMPCASADLDGDGFDDAVLAPFLAPAGPSNSRTRAGKLHVYFGRAGGISGTLDQATPPPDSVTVHGARMNDNLGCEADAADVTGDGLGDILACAQNADGFAAETSRIGAGALYVIKGRETWPTSIDLATVDPAGVTTILGAEQGERCGFWAAAGDVNGDGTKDILVSADLADSVDGSRQSVGKLYVIPGGPNLPARIDLANPTQVSSLGITVIYGVDECDHFGSCITAGDFDRDGFDDIVCSAGVSRAGAFSTGKVSGAFCSLGQGGGDGPNEDRSDTGEVYIIYGRATWPATLQLATPTPDVAIYYGQNAGDHFGEDVRTGDFDGDGILELGVGALTASAPSGIPGQPSRSRSGVGYVYWGSLLQRGERLDLQTLNSTTNRVSRIYGQAAGDIGADTIALVDVDGDGRSEMVFASPTNDPPGRNEAGDLKIIFGRPERLPAIVDLAAVPTGVTVYRVIASDPGDMFAYSFTFGDFDGDGLNDLMPNGMGGDGNLNCCRDAGELYVLSGREFASRVGRSPAGAPCLSRATVTPAGSRYFAGQTGIEIRLFCDSADPEEKFEEGAVAFLNGVEVPTEFVSASELRVRLDDAPSVRNTPGDVRAAVKNPTSPRSADLSVLTLVGPEITNVKAKRKGANLRLNIKGANFLAGATVSVTDASGTEITVTIVARKSTKKLVATIPGVASGTVLTVRVLNPGPAPSAPATVTAP